MTRTRIILLLLTCMLAMPSLVISQEIDPDDTREAHKVLDDTRQKLRLNTDLSPVRKAERMLELGMWEEAARLIYSEDKPGQEMQLVQARYLILQNEFRKAENVIQNLLAKSPSLEKAKIMRAELYVQRWDLPKARLICDELLRQDTLNREALILSGRIEMLRKHYGEAMTAAKSMQKAYPADSRGYLLESEVHFWNLESDKAEAPLRAALRIDPFNADARFFYGYAIWRKIDARLLRDMAQQWELALEINPQHYLTHWHWGNGHTHLTYVDYKRSDDVLVRIQLQYAEQEIRNGHPDAALRLAKNVQKQFPQSILPTMFMGSLYYMWYEKPMVERIDSASYYFKDVLSRKAHYGPAHNGLSACIKMRRIRYLQKFDELEAEIAAIQIQDSTLLTSLFPDVAYYPSDRVGKIIWQTLYDYKAFFPLLVEQGIKFRIPPLHMDLAEAMGNPFFREATTFDNRQWMDIRGVGSGASGIEYLERGAHLERNVLLHEFTHLFHNAAFTDAQIREVRRLYYNAKNENRVLDYYAANNEHEYLAQIIPAYYSEVKVHPLNHKSVNTARDLREKDPEAYAFVDALVGKLRAAMAGDSTAMASNWAQVYVNKSLSRIDNFQEMPNLAPEWNYLETALSWDSLYLPVYVAGARFALYEGDIEKAADWIDRGLDINGDYAPLYVQQANLTKLRFLLGKITEEVAIKRQEIFLQQAIALEQDLMYQSENILLLRDFYYENNNYLDAMTIAKNYAQQVPILSTYLQDQRDNMMAFANWLRGSIGYSSSSLEPMKELVRSKPQDYQLIGQYADVLTAAGKYIQSISELERAQKILSAAGDLNTDYMTKVAENYLIMNDKEGARRAIEPILTGLTRYDGDQYRLARVYAGIGMISEAEKELEKLKSRPEEHWKAEYQYSFGKLQMAKEELGGAETALRNTLELNPYHHLARVDLIRLLSRNGKKNDAIVVLQDAMSLALPLGPDFSAKILRYISD